ncbi:hypothetical protein G9A89_000334 [Geosiphon pyriformis]|nr:hypothetical protein G9A89_000334 [Geosiphon pyriformis]
MSLWDFVKGYWGIGLVLYTTGFGHGDLRGGGIGLLDPFCSSCCTGFIGESPFAWWSKDWDFDFDPFWFGHVFVTTPPPTTQTPRLDSTVTGSLYKDTEAIGIWDHTFNTTSEGDPLPALGLRTLLDVMDGPFYPLWFWGPKYIRLYGWITGYTKYPYPLIFARASYQYQYSRTVLASNRPSPYLNVDYRVLIGYPRGLGISLFGWDGLEQGIGIQYLLTPFRVSLTSFSHIGLIGPPLVAKPSAVRIGEAYVYECFPPLVGVCWVACWYPFAMAYWYPFELSLVRIPMSRSTTLPFSPYPPFFPEMVAVISSCLVGMAYVGAGIWPYTTLVVIRVHVLGAASLRAPYHVVTGLCGLANRLSPAYGRDVCGAPSSKPLHTFPAHACRNFKLGSRYYPSGSEVANSGIVYVSSYFPLLPYSASYGSDVWDLRPPDCHPSLLPP